MCEPLRVVRLAGFADLEADGFVVPVALGDVADRDNAAATFVSRRRGHGGAQIVGEGGDAALPGEVIADEDDLSVVDLIAVRHIGSVTKG